MKTHRLNAIYANALKTIQESDKAFWVKDRAFTSMELCLASIRLNSSNSGFYTPKAVSIKGLVGFYMLNQDGSLFIESRIIKEGESFSIEELSLSGYNYFESLVRSALN